MSDSVAAVSTDEERIRTALRDDPDIAALLPVLDDMIAVLDGAEVEYLLMGGIASSTLGRDRWTHDIDLFTRPAEARRALRVLGEAGFETDETFPEWLFKASKDRQLIDVIFRSGGDITVDDEMVRRAPKTTFMGRPVRTVPAEDLIVIKAIVAAEHTPRHWHDALAVIAATDLDWEYLMRRARHGIRRVLALLLYAQSNDLPIPCWVVTELFDRLEGRLGDGR
jgi:predicted nucleotidyltransferase